MRACGRAEERQLFLRTRDHDSQCASLPDWLPDTTISSDDERGLPPHIVLPKTSLAISCLPRMKDRTGQEEGEHSTD